MSADAKESPAAASDDTVWDVKKLVSLLPAHPKILEMKGTDGHVQYAFKCQYSNLICAGRVGIPSSAIRTPKAPSSKSKHAAPVFHGAFRDWNCAAAWIKREHNEGHLSMEMYQRLKDAIAKHGNPQDKEGFFAAPPAAWLECNAPPGSNSMSIKEWTAKYKGAGVFNGYVETAEQAYQAREDAKKEASIAKEKTKLENGDASAAKPMIRGGTKFSLSRGSRSVEAEVVGGWVSCLTTTFASNASLFETNPGTYEGHISLCMVPGDDGKKPAYRVTLASRNEESKIFVDGLQLRGFKRPAPAASSSSSSSSNKVQAVSSEMQCDEKMPEEGEIVEEKKKTKKPAKKSVKLTIDEDI